jgi:hypothetical protein
MPDPDEKRKLIRPVKALTGVAYLVFDLAKAILAEEKFVANKETG